MLSHGGVGLGVWLEKHVDADTHERQARDEHHGADELASDSVVACHDRGAHGDHQEHETAHADSERCSVGDSDVGSAVQRNESGSQNAQVREHDCCEDSGLQGLPLGLDPADSCREGEQRADA